MTTFTVNGRPVTADVEGRTHLADVLRDHFLLTGTHTGCEHGVCGACTILVDDEPVRACITYAALCEGADIRTIEGLDDDPVTILLRKTFSAEHALQCGYCTPGMLVTARDIIHRLPNATDDQIRLELAGNLCRCTGYNGIVRAIRRVLDDRPDIAPHAPQAIRSRTFDTPTPLASIEPPPINTDGLNQRLRFAVPALQLWTALQDPALIAAAIPGATLTAIDGSAITGQMAVTVGPVRIRFTGQAILAYDQPTRTGHVTGGGTDQSSGTRITAAAAFRVLEDTASASILAIDITYDLRGPLSQLAKPRIVQLMAGEIATQFGTALAARLSGAAPTKTAPLSAIGLFYRLLRRWLTGLIDPTRTKR